LASSNQKNAPKLLLAIEEPELYQHPPQCKHMSNILQDMGNGNSNTQIVLTTHSPFFVSYPKYPQIRMVRKHRKDEASRTTSATYEKLKETLENAVEETQGSEYSLMARISQIMQPSQNELFFSSVPIIVEGIEDVAMISTQMDISGNLPEFLRLGCHFVVSGGKTNISRLAAIASNLDIPFFVLFDADGNCKPDAKVNNARDNSTILRLCKVSPVEAFPTDILWGRNYAVWPNTMSDVVSQEFGTDWGVIENSVRDTYNLKDDIKRKNAILLAHILEEFNKNGKQSTTLIKLCGNILRYAEQAQL
jgi:putative ATP-dependent endonuclease of the OLD family